MFGRAVLEELAFDQVGYGRVAWACHSLDVSALGENFDATPMVLPIRGCLGSVKRLLKGDLYIGRGSRQRSLAKSRYCNTFKVSDVGREMAIERFRETLK